MHARAHIQTHTHTLSCLPHIIDTSPPAHPHHSSTGLGSEVVPPIHTQSTLGRSPVLVESPATLVTEVLCKDGLEAPQASRGGHVAHDTHHHQGRCLHNRHSLHFLPLGNFWIRPRDIGIEGSLQGPCVRGQSGRASWSPSCLKEDGASQPQGCWRQRPL